MGTTAHTPREFPGFVVWVSGLKGPECQWWAEDLPPIYDYWKHRKLATLKIDPAHQNLALADLRKLYPCPKVSQ